MLELRAKVKSWERNFEAQNNRKPTSSDIKADKSVLLMYQQYKNERRRSLNSEKLQKSPSKSENSIRNIPGTPQKNNKLAKNTPQDAQSSDTENDDEPTPLVRKVSEVFPTPSMRGKVLGLFDMEINSPYDPQKSVTTGSDASPLSKIRPDSVSTPSRSIEPETPQSKRTPDYFFQRVNLFPSQLDSMPIPKLFNTAKSEQSSQSTLKEGSDIMDEAPDLQHPSHTIPQMMDSPLVKQKTSRTKSVSDLVKEASLLHESQSISEEEGEGENNLSLQFGTNNKEGDSQMDKNKEEKHVDNETPTPMIDEFDDDLTNENAKTLESAPMTFDASIISKGKRKPKRQTKRVIMRPIDESQEVSKSKPTENYRRLTINNSARNNFKRRRRG